MIIERGRQWLKAMASLRLWGGKGDGARPMTAFQKRLVIDLAFGFITPGDFLVSYGSREPRARVALEALGAAIRERDATALTYALAAVVILGITSEYKGLLIPLFDADWHRAHEDIIFALWTLPDPDLVDVYYQATQVVPDYLRHDGDRALACKGIHGLAGLAARGVEPARERLQDIMQSRNRYLAQVAREEIQSAAVSLQASSG